MNSFFLSRSLPPHTEGSAELCEAIGASLRTQVRIFKSCTLCPDSSLRSRMTGSYLVPLCKNRFEYFTHTYFSVFYGLSAFITPVPSKAGTNASLADSPCWT